MEKVLPTLILLTSLLLVSCVPTTSGSGGRELFTVAESNTDELPEDDVLPVRPTGQVFIEPDFCLCSQGRPFITGTTCFATCQSFTGDQFTLTGRTTFGEQILLDDLFSDTPLTKFCSTPLPVEDSNGDGQIVEDSKVHCNALIKQQFSGGSEVERIIEVTNENEFRVTFDPADLVEDEIYSFRIRSRSDLLADAFSDYIQFQVKDSDDPFDYGDQLKVGTAKRYYCILRNFGDDDNIENFFIQHFMFDAANDPPVMPANSTDRVCHNDQLGTPDSPLFPRLGEEIGFQIWDKTDRRFFRNFPNGINNEGDNTGNETDINYFISRLVQEEFQVSLSGEIFIALQGPNSPSSSVPSTYGFILQPRQDVVNPIDFICPSAEQLLRPKDDPNVDPILYVLNKYNFIGDTEGLFFGLRTPREFGDNNGTSTPVDDFLFVNESQLQEIWWYKNSDNVPTLGPDRNDDDYLSIVQSKTMFFYWPEIVGSSPLVKSPSQKIYKVVTRAEAEAEINGTQPDLSGAAGAPDKKLGCIPKSP